MTMVGIVSFGVYVPRLRLDRRSAQDTLDMPLTDLAAAAKGTRSVCAPDEDALTMAVEAARTCCGRPGTTDALDAVYSAATSMPFAERKNAAVLKTALGLGDDLFTVDIAGSASCGLSALKVALSGVKGADSRAALVTASDHRLAPPGSPEELLHGDGAAALLLGTGDVVADYLGGVSLSRDTVFHYRGAMYEFGRAWEDRFCLETGYVPILKETLKTLLDRLGLRAEEVARFAIGAPSASAHVKILRALGIDDARAVDSRLYTVGDTGAAHPLLLLGDALTAAMPGDIIVVAGVGGGGEALCFRANHRIGSLKNMNNGALADETEIAAQPLPYAKFLAFRGALDIDPGIRGEIQTKAALSVMYREREMLLGFQGGRCEVCKTPQFPQSRVCVHPACARTDTQTPYRFADKTGILRTFTADYLHPSDNPPCLYGLVDFEGGGRLLMELCDCSLDELTAGVAVRMVFRRRGRDEKSGLVRYFWKATPIRRPGGEA